MAACALIGGCALQEPAPSGKPAEKPLGPGEVLSVPAAEDAVVIGKSTKADVRAALGEPIALDFASGYEVWVYRDPQRELVLLFPPSGILAKTRLR